VPEKISKKEKIIVEGIVRQSFPEAMFKVEIGGGNEVLAYLSGKIRTNHIQITVGDMVLVELSPYDLTKGRITHRS